MGLVNRRMNIYLFEDEVEMNHGSQNFRSQWLRHLKIPWNGILTDLSFLETRERQSLRNYVKKKNKGEGPFKNLVLTRRLLTPISKSIPQITTKARLAILADIKVAPDQIVAIAMP
jgi:hypothetical protein